MKEITKDNRRKFIKSSILLSTALASSKLVSMVNADPVQPSDNIYQVGPQKGYTPQIGTLLSTMTMMRAWVIDVVKALTTEQLDFQFDDRSNTIGAMLLHLAATERYYQLNTFEGLKWGSWSDEIKAVWDVPMNLGEAGRKQIKGNNIDYYLSKLEEVRASTKLEFAKRDDSWLMKSEPFFDDQLTNNHCKWFHVCEHESNHNGQIKFILTRLLT